MTFPELKAGGVKAAIEEKIAANKLSTRSAEYSRQLAAGHKMPLSTVSCVVDSYLHGDPSQHADVLDHLKDLRDAFGAYADALGSITTLVARTPGTIEHVTTGHKCQQPQAVLQRTFKD